MNLLWGLLVICCALASADERRILLRDIPTLLFESGKVGTGFRTDPVPQMTQVGGPRMSVSRIWCKNIGWDGRRVLWECRLPDDVPAVLGDFEITCEGYERSGDPYILAGSCGIEYSLKSAPQPRTAPSPSTNSESLKEAKDGPLVITTFLVVVFFFLAGLIGCIFISSSPSPNPSASKKDDDSPISTQKKIDRPQQNQPSEDENEDLDRYFEACCNKDMAKSPTRKTQEKDIFTNDEEPKRMKPRKSAKKNSSYSSPPERDEGWSTLSMGMAAAGGYLAGRSSAASATQATSSTMSPDRSYHSEPSRRSSDNSSWFSSSSSNRSSSSESYSTRSAPSGGSSMGSSSSSSAPSGFSSSSSVGGSKTR